MKLFLPALLRRSLTGTALLGSLALGAQAQVTALQPVQMARPLANSQASILASAISSTGDYYVAGTFRGQITLGTHTLSSPNTADGFVARCQAGTGTVQWVQQISGGGDDAVTQLHWHNNALYISGYFNGLGTTIGSHQLLNAHAGSSATNDVLVARLLDTGTAAQVVWAYSLGGTADDRPQALTAAGNKLYVGGAFMSTRFALGNDALTQAPPAPGSLLTPDGFVVALADDGSAARVAWMQQLGGPSAEQVTALAVSGSTVYVGGSWQTLYVGSSTIGPIVLPDSQYQAAVVGKLTDAGNSASWAWAQWLDGDRNDDLQALAVVGSAVYVGGAFQSPQLAVGVHTLVNAGSSDAYLARLDDAGTTASWGWARSWGSTESEAVSALATDGRYLYMAGIFSSLSLRLGTTTLSNPQPLPGMRNDAFISSLTESGNLMATQQIGGMGNINVYHLGSSGGQLYLSGDFDGEATFGSQPSLTMPNGYGGYLAMLPTTLLPTSAPASLPGAALFPNPAHGRAELRLPAGKGAAPFAISVLDALGRVVQRRDVPAAASEQPIALELAGLAPGVYAVRVQQDAAQAVQKLVVE